MVFSELWNYFILRIITDKIHTGGMDDHKMIIFVALRQSHNHTMVAMTNATTNTLNNIMMTFFITPPLLQIHTLV
jgi:hypothetical protein